MGRDDEKGVSAKRPILLMSDKESNRSNQRSRNGAQYATPDDLTLDCDAVVSPVNITTIEGPVINWHANFNVVIV